MILSEKSATFRDHALAEGSAAAPGCISRGADQTTSINQHGRNMCIREPLGGGCCNQAPKRTSWRLCYEQSCGDREPVAGKRNPRQLWGAGLSRPVGPKQMG